MKQNLLFIIVVIVAVVAGVWYWVTEMGMPPTLEAETPFETTQPLQQVVREPAPALDDAAPLAPAMPEQPLQPVVPPPASLSDSDAVVRDAAADLMPALVQWLMPEQQIRKWVVLVDQAADGKVPFKNRPIDYRMSAFEVQPQGEQWLLDTSNFKRAATLIDAMTAIPPERLAHYYQVWLPLLEDAYAELGKGAGFTGRVHAALDRVLNTRPLPPPILLTRPKVFYLYADAALEQASDVEKLLWRLGPAHTEKLQAYARQLKPLL